jgi:sugar phosphate isomerase/epimerase
MQIGYLISDLDQLDNVAAWGFDYAEALPGVLDPHLTDPDRAGGPEERDSLRRLESSSVSVPVLCGFIPAPEQHGLMVVGPDVDSARLRAYVARLFDLMQRASIGVIGYGSGGSRWVPDGFPRDRALDQLRDFLHLCGDVGEPRGVKVALEPYNRDDANLLNTVPEALEFVRDLDCSHVQLMADFFHMRLNGESDDELLEAGPFLIHGHIAEPGRGRPQTTSEQHAAYLLALRQAGYEGRVTQTGDLPAYATPAAAAAALVAVARS